MTKIQNHPPQLPACPGLDVGALAGAFKINDTSYKFLWLLSILDLTEKDGAELSADKIVSGMLKRAHPLIKKYRLRFGKKDRMEQFLNMQNDVSKGELHKHVFKSLVEFAPYRLLAPFFPGELSRLAAAKRHRRIRMLAEERFGGNNPAVYRFTGKSTGVDKIELHPTWLAYFQQNAGVIHGWIMWHWVFFLESRNPNRPNITRQIQPNIPRGGMHQQQRFWREIVRRRSGNCLPVKCLYSGTELNADKFVLDHYVPYSYISNNYLWNLHPVCSHANASKSDQLPHEHYFDGFTKLQYDALMICRNDFDDGANKRYGLIEYGEGLNLDMEKNINEDDFRAACEAAISSPLITAKSYGFSSDWKYAP